MRRREGGLEDQTLGSMFGRREGGRARQRAQADGKAGAADENVSAAASVIPSTSWDRSAGPPDPRKMRRREGGLEDQTLGSIVGRCEGGYARLRARADGQAGAADENVSAAASVIPSTSLGRSAGPPDPKQMRRREGGLEDQTLGSMVGRREGGHSGLRVHAGGQPAVTLVGFLPVLKAFIAKTNARFTLGGAARFRSGSSRPGGH
jgi:hypothetical protein